MASPSTKAPAEICRVIQSPFNIALPHPCSVKLIRSNIAGISTPSNDHEITANPLVGAGLPAKLLAASRAPSPASRLLHGWVFTVGFAFRSGGQNAGFTLVPN